MSDKLYYVKLAGIMKKMKEISVDRKHVWEHVSPDGDKCEFVIMINNERKYCQFQRYKMIHAPDSKDNHWKEATVAFSDGTTVKINPEYNGKRQEFPITKRTVSSMRFVSLVPDKPGKYAAFVEVEAWGRDTVAAQRQVPSGRLPDVE